MAGFLLGKHRISPTHPKQKHFLNKKLLLTVYHGEIAWRLPLWKANNMCRKTVLFNIYFLPAKANRHNALNDT